jgi:hypothetical protein
LKTSLFGIIVLLVMSVSVSTAFVESAYAEEEHPIKIVLDITYQNILESIEDAGIDPVSDEYVYFQEGEDAYNDAIAYLLEEPPNIVDAKKSALIAMALFEKTAEEIGVLEDQESTQLPASIFVIHEGITNIDNEAGELRNLIKSNDLDIDLGEFDESINLAKTILASGVVPDAQMQLILANQIMDELYVQIESDVNDKSLSSIQEVLEEQDNLGLTKKEIRELEEMLEDLSTSDSSTSESSGEGETSGDAPGQNKEDSPGSSGDAPGQNKDEGNTSENGFAIGNDLGSGKIPPGLAKLFGYEDGTGANANFVVAEGLPGFGAAIGSVSEEGLANGQGVGLGNTPPGLENIPPGQLTKLSFSFGFEQNFDDWIENHYEASVGDDHDKLNFDGTYRGHGDGKGKLGSPPSKTTSPGRDKLLAAAEEDGGPPKFALDRIYCSQFPIPGPGPLIILLGSASVSVEQNTAYDDEGFNVCDNKDGLNQGERSTTITDPFDDDKDDFNSSVLGTWTFTYTADDTDGMPAAPVVRTVIVFDPNAPIITLIGANPVEFDLNSYAELGATYSDIQDGDGPVTAGGGADGNGVTTNIDSTGLDETTEGEYTVTYTATDSDGKSSAPVDRTVYMCDVGKSWKIPPGKCVEDEP